MNSTQVTPAESIPNATITGQYDLILTSMNGHGTTNIYTSFTETGASLTGELEIRLPAHRIIRRNAKARTLRVSLSLRMAQ